MELLELGSIWHLPRDVPRNPATFQQKPKRVVSSSKLLEPGDYLRIHHNPRRFPKVYEYDWGKFQRNQPPQPQPKNPLFTANSEHPPPNNQRSSSPTPANRGNNKPGVIIGCDWDTGWIVIDKPSNVPVHGTVDNACENAVACLTEALLLVGEKEDDDDDENRIFAISAAQRLDQNTSGLIVLSTRTTFARYFSQLLYSKTKLQLHVHNNAEEKETVSSNTTSSWTNGTTNSNATTTATASNTASIGAVHKLYRCLVVLGCQPNDVNGTADKETVALEKRPLQTVEESVQWLREFASSGRILRHFLEPSIRAPKRFVLQPPPRKDNNSDEENGDDGLEWAECLLRIRKVGNQVFYLNQMSSSLDASEGRGTLGKALWGTDGGVPPNARAVVELEVELLTGRTHQIRGQLSTIQFPIVGDVQYGGALVTGSTLTTTDINDGKYEDDDIDGESRPNYYVDSERLALQCCELEFLDPDIIENEANGTIHLYPSERWNRFRLENAWWTPILQTYTKALNDISQSSDDKTEEEAGKRGAMVLNGEDPEVFALIAPTRSNHKPARPELLPPRVQLSPGRNKYVLIRATHPLDEEPRWFVKSASPEECGGLFHGNVAQDLREWIQAAGYDADVTGGGRIDLRKNPETGRDMAIIYGTSHGFGKGDHAKVAALISDWSDGQMDVSYDNSEGLY
jgi:23S rRNA-/tRNA-specific pseudouridylate synthase